MKRVGVLTSTRAEYGLLRSVIKRIWEDKDLELYLLVTGMHLCEKYGNTLREIIDDNFPIAVKIPILQEEDTAENTSRAMAEALAGFGRYFEKNPIDMLVVLGDRYETIAVCLAAMNARIPIAHIHGGEITEGAIDDAIRHAITKLSYLHFPATKEYARRIVQLGESPERVYDVGALGVENIITTDLISKDELSLSLGFDLRDPYAILTFHPVTLETNNAQIQFQEILDAIDCVKIRCIITKANADTEGHTINRMIDDYQKRNKEKVIVIASMGTRRYLSAMKYCNMVIGNSSSGILEAPSFHVPTINIGDRQKGRVAATTVINCKPQKKEIVEAIRKAQNKSFIENIQMAINPYEKHGTSRNIVQTIKEYLINDKIDLKKKFYDL